MSDYLLVQISDIHLTVDGTLLPGVRPRDNLVRALDLLRDTSLRPDVLLLTGDLADSGAGECYDDLRELVGMAAARTNASVVFLPGNHDDRGAFRRHLLDSDGGQPPLAPINQVHWRGGLRIIALDSTIPGEVHGELDAETLTFLRTELATAAPDGTVLALHHPPIPSPIEPMSQWRLGNPESLRGALVGSDVRIVLCGHNHHEALGMSGSIPVWVSPATAYRADVTMRDTFRGMPESAFSQIDLNEHGVVVTAIPVPTA